MLLRRNRLDIRGGQFEKVRRAADIQTIVDQVTADVAAACGKGYVASTRQGRSRYRGIVYPDTHRARRDARRNNTMLNVAAVLGMKIGGGGL